MLPQPGNVIGTILGAAAKMLPTRLEFLMTTKSDLVLGTRSSLLLAGKKDYEFTSDTGVGRLVQSLSRTLALISSVEFLALGLVGPTFSSTDSLPSALLKPAGILSAICFGTLYAVVIGSMMRDSIEVAAQWAQRVLNGLSWLIDIGINIAAGIGIFIALAAALLMAYAPHGPGAGWFYGQ
jgi:hypothetical protein